MSQESPQNAKLDRDNDKLLSVPLDRGYAFTHPPRSSQTMWTSLLKFVIGVLVGLMLLVGIGSAIGYYFINRLATAPPKPIFSEEKNTSAKKAPIKNPDELPAGAYRGRVIPRQGLSLRAEADKSADKLGVAAYNQEVIVLKSNGDKEWARIRVKATGKEGWVRTNNIERLDVPKPEAEKQPSPSPR